MKAPYLFPCAGIALVLSLSAQASEVEVLRHELRRELAQVQRDYEARLAELEFRLKETESRAAAATPPAPAAAPPQGGFNPEVSLILQGRYVDKKALDERHITGFIPVGGHDEHGHAAAGRGFSLDHTELVFSANIDSYVRGFATLALFDEEVEVEEAGFQTLGLGHGLTLKGGRFRSNLGYLNEQHAHAWDFADTALMYQALFGESYTNDGLQLKWIAPFSDLLVEVSGEIGRGDTFPGTERDKNGANAGILGLHLGGDVGASHSWRAGLAFLDTRAEQRGFEGHDTADEELEAEFSGKSKTWLADIVWKWAPDGNPKYRNLKLQAEYFLRKENGDLACDDDAGASVCAGGLEGDFRSRQSGWYAQAIHQFLPRWRVGYRYDRLDRGDMAFLGADIGDTIASLEDYTPQRHSLMLDFNPSEFSRLRLQFARDRSMHAVTDNQLTLQYIYSLGAHGAHKF
ncbi:MAG: TonB-dependent receptor [Gammaproteobacteria bacterium]